jgi:hypothetical protein
MNKKLPYHVPPGYANTVIEWFPTDSRESFHRMMQDPIHRAYFERKGWDRPGAITYRFNSDGFRSEEFDYTADNLVTLGCSFTMGVGLPESDIWPTLLGQELNLRVCNLGWGGRSADSCFRLAEYWIPRINPKLVVMCTPPSGRLEVVIDNITGQTYDYMPHEDHTDKYLKQYLANDTNSVINRRKNELAVWAICKQLNIPCLIYQASEEFCGSREELEYARDYMHAGPAGHRKFTNKVLNEWRKEQP